MKTRCAQVSLLTIMFLFASFVQAETEIIPFAGYRTSGDFTEVNTNTTLTVDETSAFGFVINSDYERDTQLEFLYSSQSSTLRAGDPVATNALFDIDIDYYHVGGVALYPLKENMNSFVGMGIGMTHFSPNLSGYSSATELSFNISGGIKQDIGQHLGYRLGVTFFGTTVDKNSSVFCSNGACNIHFSSSLFTQFEFSAGLVLRF